MSSPAPFGNLRGGTKEFCNGLETTVAAVTLTSNERTTSFTLAEQSTATASTSIPRSSMDKISYKLLSTRRRLVNAIKHLRDDLSGVSSLVSFNKIALEFHNSSGHTRNSAPKLIKSLIWHMLVSLFVIWLLIMKIYVIVLKILNRVLLVRLHVMRMMLLLRLLTVSHKPRWVELVRPVKVLLHAVLS